MKAALVVIAVAAGGLLGAQADAETPLERGTYLMKSIVACGNCHTPKTADGPDPARELAGAFVIENPVFKAYAPNITQDRETGIGGWSDDEIIAAIRDGRRRDGSIIGPPMPIWMYRGISDGDVRAIVAYLRTVPPVANTVPRTTYRVPLPESYGPLVTHVAELPRDDIAAYGGYLAGPLGHCMECHSPVVRGVPDFANQLGAGGTIFPMPLGESVARNITPHADSMVPGYSDQELKAIIATGVRPDGSQMLPPMGYSYYRNIEDRDLDAIVAYLRTLEPRQFP